jgi:polysaccharide biosynthesis/export protein
MNGTGRCGLETMFKKIAIIGSTLALSSCGILPGMQNLDTTKMRKQTVPERIEVHPTLIPITPSLIANQRISTYFYHVAPADVLNISVWEHPEFSFNVGASVGAASAGQGNGGGGGYFVNKHGDIYFPLIGSVRVANKTVDSIRSEISYRLRQYVPNPQIDVRVSDFRGQKIYVLGEVAKTGFLPITDQQMTIADALALSGWLDSNAANPRYIYVIRGDYTRPQIFWLDAVTPDRLLLAERFSLKPRDILYVSVAPITNANRVLGQFLPIVQSLWFTKALVQ